MAAASPSTRAIERDLRRCLADDSRIAAEGFSSRHAARPRKTVTPQPWSGRFAEAGRRARPALYRVGVVRPSGSPSSTSQGSLAHARMLAACGDDRRSGPRRHRARPGDDPRRDPRGHVRVVARGRGRAPQHRAAPHRARRRRRQAAAHRALAQRPGGDRRAAVAARRDRRDRRARCATLQERARRPRRARMPPR